MSRHYHFESRMSLTGSNADYRVAVAPSELGVVALNLLDAITGSSTAGGAKLKDEAKQARLKEAAEWLKNTAANL